MTPAVKIAAATLLAGAAYYFYRSRLVQTSGDSGYEAVIDVVSDAAQETIEILDQFTGGTMKLSAMSKVTGADVANGNVQAFLRVIRRGEGTSGDIGYRTIFGGSTFASYADHPRIKISKGIYTSTAAGAYQALASTWDETRRIMGLADFSPASQDLFAVGRIAARGALDDVKAGRLDTAIKKCAKEWASLPYSPYGQPVISMATAASVFSSNGGVVTV